MIPRTEKREEKTMAGKKYSLPDENGNCETVSALCTFAYAGNRYVITEEKVCRKLEWTLTKGIRLLSEEVSERASEAAESLICKSSEEPSEYTLCGEYYRVGRSEEGGFVFTKKQKCPLFPIAGAISFIFAMLFAALFAYLYTESFGITWGKAVFPHIPRMPLKILLYGIGSAGCAALFFVRKMNRTWLDLCLNTLIPLNLVTTVGVAKSNLIARIIIICLAVLILLFRVILPIVSVKSKRSEKSAKIRVRRLLDGLYMPVLILAVGCLLAARIFGIDGYANTSFHVPDEDLTARYHQALPKLYAEKWKELDTQEKLDVLQRVCDYECVEILGCRTATVQTGYPQSPEIHGEYNHLTNTVMIQIDYLNEGTVSDVLKTLLHETRHVYQWHIAEVFNKVEEKLDEQDMKLPMFRLAAEIRDETDNYRNALSDFEEYYGQKAESDSRNWAEKEFSERYGYTVSEE